MIVFLASLLVLSLSTSHLRHLHLHRYRQPLQASDLDNAEVTHFSTHYEIVTDRRVVKTMNVPDVFQATEYTCGPASLTAVLNYFHIDKRQAQLAKMAKTTEEDGTDPYDLLKTIEALGLRGQLMENMTINDLQGYLSGGYPVMVLIQAWKDDDDPTPYPEDVQDGHYVVAIGYDQDYFYFEDPWIIGSLTYMRKNEIMGRWHGDTIYPKPRVVYGCGIIVLKGKEENKPVIHLD